MFIFCYQEWIWPENNKQMKINFQHFIYIYLIKINLSCSNSPFRSKNKQPIQTTKVEEFAARYSTKRTREAVFAYLQLTQILQLNYQQSFQLLATIAYLHKWNNHIDGCRYKIQLPVRCTHIQ